MSRGTMPRAWVGCLACYNEMKLVGAWYDADDAGNITVERVHRDGGGDLTGLDTPDAYRFSPDGGEPVQLVDGHEEIWVMDHDGFGGLIDGECSVTTIADVWEVIGDLDDADRTALGLYRAHSGGDLNSETVEKFRDAYRGIWDSEKDFAQDWAESSEAIREVTWPYTCIDWDHATRELFYDFWSDHAKDGMVYVFAND